MHFLLMQAAVDGGGRVDPAWVIAALTSAIGTLATVVGILYRAQVKVLEGESRRKDELIDRLIRQISRTTEVQDRAVSVAERHRGTHQ